MKSRIFTKLFIFGVLGVFLLSVLPASIASVEESNIFSGTVLTNTEKIIEGGKFRFIYEKSQDKVFVVTPFGDLIVNNNNCESNSRFKVCINKVNFSHKNFTTYAYYYNIDTTIYKRAGKLITSFNVVPDRLLQQQSARFTITFSNPTIFPISNISYSQEFKNFLVTEIDGCTLDGNDRNKIVWSGSIEPNYQESCTATIVAQEDGKFELEGNISYFDFYDTQKEKVKSIPIEVLPKKLKVVQNIDKSIEVKSPFYFNISLTNIDLIEDIDASISISLPAQIAIINDAGFNQDLNFLKHKVKIEHGSTKNYSFYLESKSEINEEIKQNYAYEIKNIVDTIENNVLINVVEPKPIIELFTEHDELEPGQNFVVIVYIKNPSTYHPFKDIKASLDFGAENIEKDLENLMPNVKFTVINKTLITPKNLSTGVNKTIINLDIYYKFEGIERSLNKYLELGIKNESKSINQTKKSIQTTELKTPVIENPNKLSKWQFLVLFALIIMISYFFFIIKRGIRKNI